MSKKSCLLISLVLVFGFSNIHSAYGQGDVWWVDQAEDANNHFWNGPNNWAHWDDGIEDVVLGNEPNLWDTVYIGKGVLEKPWPPTLFDYINEASPFEEKTPVIDSGMNARCYGLWGPGGSWEGEGWYWYLNILGGSLTIGDMNYPDWSMRWEIAGTDGVGEVNMVDGVVNVAGDMVIGNWGGLGEVNMVGGEINVGWGLCIPGTDEGSDDAIGVLKLHGGTIRCGDLYINEWITSEGRESAGSSGMKDDSMVDFTEGIMIIDGSYAEHIARFVSEERITVYGVQEGDIAPDGRRAYVKVDYDEVEDTTTVTGATADLEQAYNPSPVHYSQGQPINVVLSWSAGDGAVSHDVYLGTSFDDVNDADTSDLSGIYRGTQPDSTYNPPEYLTVLTSYYWRIDEFDGADTWKGRVWCFTVANYRGVDNFDSYSNDYDLWEVWKDFADPENYSRAQVYLEDRKIFEPDGYEMEYRYNSAYASLGSEAFASMTDLGIDSDWTTGGITKSLALSFYGGDPDNSVTENDQMYVALKDTFDTIGVVPYDGEPTDVNEQEWHEWNIDFQEFTDLGVDLTSIETLYIGFGGPRVGQTAPGGDGIVYFNDIAIYPPRCVPEKAMADITGDCVVGMEDLELMAEDWLEYDHDVYPTEPAPTGLVAWYEFEDSYNVGLDSSGNGLHGDPCGDAYIVYDAGGNGKLPGNVLSLESVGAYINCGSDPMFDITESITLSCWLKVNSFDQWWVQILSRGQDSYRLASNEGKDWLEFVAEGVYPGWYIYGSIGVADGQWHHVIGVYEHNVAMSIYIDGVVDVSQAMNGDIILSEADVYIGSNAHSPTNLNGWMDDVRIYNRALSQAEILYLASEGASSDPYYNPVISPANVYDEEDPYEKSVNFRDYAIISDNWLEEILWP